MAKESVQKGYLYVSQLNSRWITLIAMVTGSKVVVHLDNKGSKYTFTMIMMVIFPSDAAGMERNTMRHTLQPKHLTWDSASLSILMSVIIYSQQKLVPNSVFASFSILNNMNMYEAQAQMQGSRSVYRTQLQYAGVKVSIQGHGQDPGVRAVGRGQDQDKGLGSVPMSQG